MNYIDIIFALIIIWAIIRGWTTGFIVQLAGLVAMVIGAFAAYKLSYLVAGKISESLNADPIIVNSIAFIITFIVVWGLVVLLGKFLNIIVKAAMLSMVNRFFGVVFSVAKAVFAISILLMLIGNLNTTFNIIPKEQTEKSLLYKPIEAFAPAVFPYLKTGFERAQNQWNEYQKKVEDKVGKQKTDESKN